MKALQRILSLIVAVCALLQLFWKSIDFPITQIGMGVLVCTYGIEGWMQKKWKAALLFGALGVLCIFLAVWDYLR